MVFDSQLLTIEYYSAISKIVRDRYPNVEQTFFSLRLIPSSGITIIIEAQVFMLKYITWYQIDILTLTIK